MSKTVKAFLIFLIVFFSVILSLTIAVNEKIKPQEISNFIKTTIKTISPNVEVKVGKVDYSMGTMVRIYINQVEINDKSVNLLKVRKITCKLPLLSTVFGSGTIKIKVEEPYVNRDIQQHMSVGKVNKLALHIPAFIEKNKLDLNIKDVLIKNNKKEVQLKKVLIKNLSLNKSMAYEVVGKSKILFNQTKVIADTQIIGEVNLNNFTDSKDIESNIMIDFKNVKTEFGRVLPRGRGKFDISWNNQKRVLTGKGKFNLNTVLDSEFSFITDFSFLTFNEIQASIINKELPKIFKGKFFDKLDYQDSVTLIKGKIQYSFINDDIDPVLKINLKKPIRYTLNETPILFSLNANILKQNIDAKINKKFLGGEITSDLKIDLRKKSFDFNSSNIKKVTGNVFVTGIKIDRSFFKTILKKEESNENKIVEIDFKEKVTKKKTTISLKIDGKNNFVGKAKVDMNGLFKQEKKEIKLEKWNIKTDTGSLKLDLSKKNSNVNFDLFVKKLELKDYVPLFPLLVPNLTGTLSGHAKGFVSKEKYRVDTQVQIKDFIIGLVDLSTPVNNFLKDINQKALYDINERLNSFKLIDANFTKHDAGLNIKKAKIVSDKAKINITKSIIKKNDESYILGELITDKKIPFKFTGQDHTLNSDIEYTLKKLGRKAKK